jgi:hypothetical protein
MTSFEKKIVGYLADLLPGDPDNPAVIIIYCEDDYRLLLIFLEKPIPGLVNQFDPSDKTGFAFLEGTSQYPHYIDLLRNEGPLSALINADATPSGFQIYTAETEGVGEGEIASTLGEIKSRLDKL